MRNPYNSRLFFINIIFNMFYSVIQHAFHTVHIRYFLVFSTLPYGNLIVSFQRAILIVFSILPIIFLFMFTFSFLLKSLVLAAAPDKHYRPFYLLFLYYLLKIFYLHFKFREVHKFSYLSPVSYPIFIIIIPPPMNICILISINPYNSLPFFFFYLFYANYLSSLQLQT